MQGGRRVDEVAARLPVRRLPKTTAALGFAARAHAGQRRAVDGAPFIVHPLEVAALLCDDGQPDRVVAAGLLHDVIEKTPVQAAELRAEFGPAIASIVATVSEDERIADYQTRKRALRRRVALGGEEALVVFAADKVSKLRELGRSRRFGGHLPRVELRMAHYAECVALLEQRLGTSPLVAVLKREYEALADFDNTPLSPYVSL